MQVDAIVNTANPKPVFGSGTDYAIYQAAGAQRLLAERKKIGEIARGDAVSTPAFDLPAKYIIHTVGPSWRGGDRGEFEVLRSCYRKSLKLALKLSCDSVAFPLISSGTYGFPKSEALEIAMNEIQKFTMHNEMDVYLVVFDGKAFELSQNTFGKIEAFIDANYVEEATMYEGHRRRENLSRMDYVPAKVPSLSIEQIGKLLAPKEASFQEKLFEYIDASTLTGPEIYKNMMISRQMYSSIQQNKDYQPQKSTAILFCLTLHLDLEQTKDLLGRAGYTLSKSSMSDVIVTACIENKVYDLYKIDAVMVEKNIPTLRKYGMTKK